MEHQLITAHASKLIVFGIRLRITLMKVTISTFPITIPKGQYCW